MLASSIPAGQHLAARLRGHLRRRAHPRQPLSGRGGRRLHVRLRLGVLRLARPAAADRPGALSGSGAVRRPAGATVPRLPSGHQGAARNRGAGRALPLPERRSRRCRFSAACATPTRRTSCDCSPSPRSSIRSAVSAASSWSPAIAIATAILSLLLHLGGTGRRRPLALAHRFGPVGMAWANFLPLGAPVLIWSLARIDRPGLGRLVAATSLEVYGAPLAPLRSRLVGLRRRGLAPLRPLRPRRARQPRLVLVALRRPFPGLFPRPGSAGSAGRSDPIE